MSPEWIIALCALGGAIGGAVGAWATLRVTVAVHGQRLAAIDLEITSLRHDRHEHAKMIQDHEARLGFLENPHWRERK